MCAVCKCGSQYSINLKTDPFLINEEQSPFLFIAKYDVAWQNIVLYVRENWLWNKMLPRFLLIGSLSPFPPPKKKHAVIFFVSEGSLITACTEGRKKSNLQFNACFFHWHFMYILLEISKNRRKKKLTLVFSPWSEMRLNKFLYENRNFFTFENATLLSN